MLRLPSSVATMVVLCLSGSLIADQSAYSVDAWMSTPPSALLSSRKINSSTTTTTTSTTQRYMFDWFNKPKPTDESKKTDKDSTNMFTNMFNQMSPPANKPATDEEHHHQQHHDEKPAALSHENIVLEEEEISEKEKAIITEIQAALDAVVPPDSVGSSSPPTTNSEPVAAVVDEVAEEKTPSSISTTIDVTHEIHVGKVKWFDPTKGYGFITPDDGSNDVFVHQSEIQVEGFRKLIAGESVEYGVVPDEKGARVIHVTGPKGSALEVSKRRQQNASQEE